MPRLLAVATAAGLAALCPRPASANDSSALLEAGGLVLTRSDGITMESEDLLISVEKVRVSYRFRNDTTKDIIVRVAFPLPEFEQEGEGDIRLDTQSRNPMKFSLVVDGRKTPYHTEIKKAGGKVNVTHHWEQRFPAGKTVSIVHDYRPVAGGFFGPDRAAPDPELDKHLATTYCVGPRLLEAMKASPNFLWAVHYILRTGANWKGPIGRFRLVLQKVSAKDRISVCLPDTRRLSPTTFVVERTNFEPTDDLRVLFVPGGS